MSEITSSQIKSLKKDTELLESIVFNAVARAKQLNYEIEMLEDSERDSGNPQPPRPRIPISSLLNGPRTPEFVYNSRGRRIHVRTDWTSAYELLGLNSKPYTKQFTTPTKGVVILVHGLNGHANRPTWGFLAHRYQEAGYHPVGFDFHGHGYSDRFCPGTQNPYYSYTRALISDYTELVDDMLWVISKLFVTDSEVHAHELGKDEDDSVLLSEYYLTPGGRKRKGRADSLTQADLEELRERQSHGDVDADDLYHDFHLRHRFMPNTPLFIQGVSMGGACAIIISSILCKFQKAHRRAAAAGNPGALFSDMNAISLEDPVKRTIPVRAPSVHTESGSDSAVNHHAADSAADSATETNLSSEATAFDNDEEDSEGLQKMLIHPFVNIYHFLQEEFSSVTSSVNQVTQRVHDRVVRVTSSVGNKVLAVKNKVENKVLAVKNKVEERVQRVRHTVVDKVHQLESQVMAVKRRVHGELLDVFEGRVGVHGMGSNVSSEGSTAPAEPDWLDAVLGRLDANQNEDYAEPAYYAAGEDRGDTILYNGYEYPRQMLLHLGKVASLSFAGAILVSPACAVDTPHPALVTFLKHFAVPLMPTLVVPQALRRSDDSTNWSSVSFRSYNKTDGYPSGLSWGENVKFRTAYTILNMMQAVNDEIPHMDFPYLAIHDPLDRVTAFTGVKHLMEVAGSEVDATEASTSPLQPEQEEYLRCPSLKGGDLYVLRRNRLGRLVVVPEGKHDIASNNTDLLLREVLAFANELTGNRAPVAAPISSPPSSRTYATISEIRTQDLTETQERQPRAAANKRRRK